MKKIRHIFSSKKQLIFSYGNIINPNATLPVFRTSFPILGSVFIIGYKLILKKAPNSKNMGYHNIICTYTGNEEDIIPGFLTEVPENLISLMDMWEGANYQRKDVICFDRFKKPINCQMYMNKDD